MKGGDREALACIEDEVVRGRAERWAFWYRRNSHKLAAGEEAVRRLLVRSGPGIAPSDLVREMRKAPPPVKRVPISNDAGVFLARVLALTVPEFKEVFDFRKSAADALLAAGWVP